MNDLELRAVYQRLMALRSDQTRRECASPEQIVALADGTLPESERIKLLTHVASCTFCQRDLGVARAVATSGEQPGISRRPWIGAALVAAAAVLIFAVVVRRIDRASETDVMRSADTTVEIVRPTGQVAPTDTVLIWKAVPGATQYRFEILTLGGAVVYSGASADTSVAMSPRQPGEYFWRVSASLADGSTRASPAQRFEVRAR